MKPINVARVLLFLGLGLLLACGAAFAQTEPVEINIDVKPGSCVNPVNVASRGVLPIVILGTEDFDVADIDPTMIQLQFNSLPLTVEGEPIMVFKKVIMEDLTGPPTETMTCADESPDGFVDLLVRFRVREISEALGEAGIVVNRGDTATLTVCATLLDGTVVEGSDEIRILKPRRK